MSIHIFANIVTPYGIASNNRAENEGNVTTLQKILWQGATHSTVSAEAIRFGIRKYLFEQDPKTVNRHWDDTIRSNAWKDASFATWQNYVDSDLLGFMNAEAAKEEAETLTDESPDELDNSGKKKRTKGKATVRRSPLEITRAISLTPWPGDVTFNAASPGATASASKGSNPALYGTEQHATRYQYGMALTPERLHDKSRAFTALKALAALNRVAGNHGRYLFDFSPESIVLRITDDPAPRLLYCFETEDNGKTITTPELLRRVSCGDIPAEELILGGPIVSSDVGQKLKAAKVLTFDGVLEAMAKLEERLKAKLETLSK